MGILLNVTDNQLFASKYVTLIFLILLVFGTALNIRQLLKATSTPMKIRKGIFALILCSIIIPVYWIYDINSSLLTEAIYTSGKTLNYCKVFAKGEGIEFEYEVNGMVYTNCNTFHPKPKEMLIVPNGTYSVRYSNKYPDKGRIDFNKPLNEISLANK